MKRYFLQLLFYVMLNGLAAQTDCYNVLRTQGVHFLAKTDYRHAVDEFFAARYCPDKPENDDLDDLIKKTLNQWVRALDKARQRAETAEREARLLAAQADTLRTYLRGDSTYANFLRSGKINFENGSYQEALYDFTIARFVKETAEARTWISKTQQALQAEEWAATGNVEDAYEAFQTLDSLDANDYRSERLEQLQLTREKWNKALHGRNLTTLDTLDLSGKGDVLELYVLPTDIAKAKNLTTLFLQNNELTQLSPEIGKLPLLQTLYVHSNQITQLPAAIGQLTQLRRLDMTNNDLETLPTAIGKLLKLETLLLGRNELAKLPVELGRLTALQTLDLSDNNLSELTLQDWLFLIKLKNLQTLHIQQNELPSATVEHIRSLVPKNCSVISD